MHTEYLFLDNSSDRKVVEEICEELPDIRTPELPLAFSVESIDLGDLSGLMIASK